MKHYFDSFDAELSQGLQEAASRIVSPDKDEVWADISRKIEGINRKEGIPVLKKLAAAAAVLILLLTGVFAAAGDYALADFRFFKTIKSVFSNVVSISGVTRTDNEVPTVSNQNIVENNDEKALCSLEEARQSLDYDIAVPGYIPTSYTLDRVFIRENKNSLSPVELHYKDSVSGNELIIDESPISQATSFSYNFRSNDAETSTVQVSEYEATLIYFKNTGIRKLLWQTQDKYYIVSADLDEKEIMAVASSLDN